MAGSFVSRRLSEFLGVALFAVALLWLISLASYSAADPVWFFTSSGSDAAPVNFGGRVGAFLAELSALDEVDYVVITAGSFDIIVELVCPDDDGLLELLNHRIRAIPAVRSSETFIYLKLMKQTYAWGTR